MEVKFIQKQSQKKSNLKKRQKKIIKHWSPEDITTLIFLSVNGFKRCAISSVLGRANELVFSKLQKHILML